MCVDMMSLLAYNEFRDYASGKYIEQSFRARLPHNLYIMNRDTKTIDEF